MSQVNDSVRRSDSILRHNRKREIAASKQNVQQAKILIGYFMRSGSTLLQHILDQHSNIQSFSDLSSISALMKVMTGARFRSNICVKPMDVMFLGKRIPMVSKFDKRVWIARDPRDSYLSAIESGYAYRAWPKGKKIRGIDAGLLNRWQRIHKHYFENPNDWHFMRYEDLVSDPASTLTHLFDFLELEYEELLPFEKFDYNNGGDYKICETNTIVTKSKHRYKRELDSRQMKIFDRLIGEEMELLGYSRSE